MKLLKEIVRYGILSVVCLWYYLSTKNIKLISNKTQSETSLNPEIKDQLEYILNMIINIYNQPEVNIFDLKGYYSNQTKIKAAVEEIYKLRKTLLYKPELKDQVEVILKFMLSEVQNKDSTTSRIIRKSVYPTSSGVLRMDLSYKINHLVLAIKKLILEGSYQSKEGIFLWIDDLLTFMWKENLLRKKENYGLLARDIPKNLTSLEYLDLLNKMFEEYSGQITEYLKLERKYDKELNCSEDIIKASTITELIDENIAVQDIILDKIREVVLVEDYINTSAVDLFIVSNFENKTFEVFKSEDLRNLKFRNIFKDQLKYKGLPKAKYKAFE